jgi:Mrp family chromosome partitioning ATPase
MNFGLSGALTGAGNWRDAVLALPEAPNLFILQSGLRPPNSSELLGSLQMNDFIEEWKAEYDQVIIDSPPCLLVTDSVLLAQRTDVVLLVSRIAVTPRSSLRQASELLSGDGHISGIVVNDVGVAESHYGYTYGYGYGYGNKGRESYYAEEEC